MVDFNAQLNQDMHRADTSAEYNETLQKWVQPVSTPDGLNVTLGAKVDTLVTNPALQASVIALLKGILSKSDAENKILKGTATGGSATDLIDTTKDFQLGLLTGKPVKITIDGTDYWRRITDNIPQAFAFSSIYPGSVDSVTVTGAGGGSMTIACKAFGVSGYSIILLAGTGIGQPGTVVFADDLLTITSPTDGSGTPMGIYPGNVESEINSTPELAVLFEVTHYNAGLVLDVMTEPADFAGGSVPIVVTAGTPYEIYDQPIGAQNVILTGETIEILTDAVRVIPTDHAYIHAGIGHKFSLNIGTLNAAASMSFSFKTPASKYIHFKDLKLTSMGAGVRLDIRRGTSATPLVIDSPGSAATELVGPNNLNDNSTNVSGVTILKTPTYTGGATGTIWDSIQIVGDSTNQFATVVETKISDNDELVMKPDTYYVFTITNLSAGGGDAAQQVFVNGFFYEEDAGF